MLMNPIASTNNSNTLGLPQAAGSTSHQTGTSTPVLTDSQVVSKVIATSQVKSSDLAQVTQPSRDVIAKAAQQIQSFVQSMGRNLNFSVDQSTGYHIVRVVNPDTNEVVRQLPSEEMLKIAQTMSHLNNVLVSQKA
jgi:flagellar protein FlaG